MLTRLQKLRRLPAEERWLLVQSAVLLPIVHLALKFISVARLQGLVTRAMRAPRPRQISPQATARMVRIAAHRGLYHFKCLDQSLVLGWLLRRHGTDARIVFGARKEDNQMEAHAWVEVDGLALNDDIHQHFSPFEELNATSVNLTTQ